MNQIPENAKLAEVIKVVNELRETIQKLSVKRDRGPESKREMTESDAIRVTSGDLKDEKTKIAAEKLGLSYGQVYSARNGHTFKKPVAQHAVQK